MTNELHNCGDCGACPGELHMQGCDVERCPRCGFQAIGCDCIYVVCGMDPDELETEFPEIFNHGPTQAMYATWDKAWAHRRLPWTGEFPGCAECREFGLWAVFVEGKGWKRVPAGTPGASEDLNGLYMWGRWDPKTQKWTMP